MTNPLACIGYEPESMGPVEDAWRPAPVPYAGWFGHAEMRRDGDRLILSVDRREVYWPAWCDLMDDLRECHPWIGSIVLRDPSGEAIGGRVFH